MRDAAIALYAFCRVADDAVDLGHDARAVDALRGRLARVYAGSPADSPVDRAFARMVAAYDLPRALMDALLEGFAWDAEGRRYTTPSELSAYAARVAGAVGAMMTILMGERAPHVLARACDLGVAMQLTNIARDVGEDARNGRIYLPLAWLDEEGVDAREMLSRPRPSLGLARVVDRVLVRADGLYARANAGIGELPRDCRLAVLAASRIYGAIGAEVRRRGLDSITSRAVVSPARKLWLILEAVFAVRRLEGDARRVPALAEAQFVVDAACGGSA
jgi:phytoene synthase